jgi:hypothetical protein
MSASTATLVLDGDHPGHAFRGNQHVTASRESATAGAASRKAKRAEKAGDPKALKKAHRGAYHAHMAALEDAKGTTRKYHRTMAKFHGKQAGVVLDGVEELDPPEHAGPIRMLLTPEAQALLDKVGPINVFQSGDKVVSLDDNADYVVTGQRAHLVSVKGKKEPIVSNRLKLANGGKPATLILDAGGEEDLESEEEGDADEFDDYEVIFDKVYSGEKKYNPKTDRWVTTETGSRLLIRGEHVIGGAAGKLNGKNKHGVQKATFTVSPARYAKGKMIVRAPSTDGYKTQAGRIAEAVGGKYSGREKGYVMAPTRAKLMEHLMDVGAEANIMDNRVTIGEQKDLSPADAKKHLKTLGYKFDSVYFDAAGGLFGDAEGGYIVGTISRGAVALATVHVRGDGKTAFAALPALEQMMKDNGDMDPAVEATRETLAGGWDVGTSGVLFEMAEIARENEETAAANVAGMEAEAKVKAEREAQLAADESARAAALDEAQAFGKGKPGFVGAIADRGGDAIKGALARKPVGSWILVLAKMSSSSDAGPGVQGDNRSAFAMFSRQMLGKGGRSINPAGKIGNVQVSRLMATAAEAYQSGIQTLMNAGGVVLGMSGKPLNADGSDPGAPAAEPVELTDAQKADAIDAIYKFTAPESFKAWVWESRDKTDYSPFVTAKAMDEEAKRLGAAVRWLDPDGGKGHVGEIVRGGAVAGRIDMGGDGKAMVFVGTEGDQRVSYISKVDGERRTFMYSDDDAGEMVTALLGEPDAGTPPSGPTYRYALVNRPAMIGGLPSKLEYTVEPRPAPGQPHYEMARHGILVTQRELTTAELKSFELAPLVDGPLLDVLAAKIAESMGKYAAQYIEALEDNPGMFRNKVLDVAERPDSGVRYSIGAPDALVDRVEMLLRGMAEKKGGGEDSEPFEHMGLKISVSNVRSADGSVSSRWIVQSPENAQREKAGERQLGGDAIVSSRADAIKRAEELVAEEQKRAAWQSEVAAKEAAIKAEEEARRQRNAGKTIGQLKSEKTLESEIQSGGKVMTRRQWVEEKVAEGLKPKITQEDRIQPMSRAQFNRASNEEQRAHERKIKEAGKKDVHWIGDFSVTKTEHDYALEVMGRQAAPNIGAPAGDTQRVADMATLQQIAAGTHPEMLEPELADQIEAAMTRYPDDAELQALAEKAINAYSDGMMAATASM